MSLAEVACAVALLGLVAATAITTLTLLNKNASAARAMTAAKEVVQRNIEAAIGSPFTSDFIPPILVETQPANQPPVWTVWDEVNGSNLALNQTSVLESRDASSKITGTLYRTVKREPSVDDAEVRRITMRMSYTLFGRPQSYEMTTIRATDR